MRKIRYFILWALPIVAVLTALSAFAGVEDSNKLGPKDGGGGKGYRCRGADKMYTHLADTYEWMQDRRSKVEPVEPGAVVAAAIAVFDQYYPERNFPHPYNPGEKVSLGWMIEYTHARLVFRPDNVFIPDFPDDNIPESSIPPGCTKVQIAFQDLKTGIVHVDMDLERSLTFFDRGFLELHETLIALRNMPGADTTPIRKEVKSIAQILDDPRLSIHELVKKLFTWVDMRPTYKGPFNQESYKRKCYNESITLPPSNSASENQKRCYELKLLSIEETKAEMRKLAVPTLLEIPTTLQCQVTVTTSNHLKLPNPGKVILRRVSGSGRPDDFDSLYELEFSEGQAPVGPSWKTWFDTRSNERQNIFRDFGSHQFSTTWDIGDGRDVTVRLGDFLPRTKIFKGSVQIVDEKLEEFNKFAHYSHFEMFCDGSAARYGLDL